MNETTPDFASDILDLWPHEALRFKFEGHEMTASVSVEVDNLELHSSFDFSCDGVPIEYCTHAAHEVVFDARCAPVDLCVFEAALCSIFREHIATQQPKKPRVPSNGRHVRFAKYIKQSKGK